MNIIEAIVRAENGALITNNFMDYGNYFLKYKGEGLFHQYKVIDGKPIYIADIREFTMAYVISSGWRVLSENYFNK
jgi:hypothetical protein